MEAVKAFNSELSSLYEVKPPISKAKMTALTRGAIKAIKFYKHVVQSVEKFILKCKPEYKVPGLYVIDSIVRQSRHQFGPEKDVFAPRFSKNLQQTFVNLFKCPAEDKSKIIRVLNLWQKNQVFAPEDIQPLFDLADPNNPIYQQIQQQSTPVQQTNGAQPQPVKGSPALQRTPTKASQAAASEASAPNLVLTEPVLQQLQQLQRLLVKGADARQEQVHFDKKLLDFDYGDDEDEVNPSPRPPPSAAPAAESVANLLSNPEVLRQLQTLQNTLAGAVNPAVPENELDRMRKLHEMKMQEDEFDKHLAQTVPNLPFAAECTEFKMSQTASMIGGLHFIPPQPDGIHVAPGYETRDGGNLFGNQNNSGNDVEVITLDHDDSQSDDERYKRKRSRSRSRDRGRDKDRRRRSRSRSRSRGRRHRSKSRDRKDKDKKEKETERDKERKKRGLPAIKSNNLSVCSTTLWVGHLSKLVHQDDLSNTFGEFGDIVSIDLIIPRGCAFIVMHRRQDAARCLTKLKNYNLHGKAITLAWAPGKGVKGKDLKDYWEGDLGVSYIPWGKLKMDIDLEALEDGGMIDEDTMPEWMRKKIEETTRNKLALEPPPFLMGVGEVSNQSSIDTTQPPPLPPSNMMQPPIMPMVNPFQLNNRFLSMIPNLANLPLGVPPPNMMPNLGLGLNSPFQGPPSFISPALPPPQQQEAKPTPPPTTDIKLRNLSESLMNLAGQPLTVPPQLLNQPPPPLHGILDDNMDIEMEDAVHPDMNKPPPNLSMDMQFNRDSRDSRFSPGRRDRDRDNRRERSGDRGRRRSRSRERDRSGRDRDRRERDFGRGVRDRPRVRDRANRWGPPDRREDRSFDRRGGLGRRDTSFDRRRDSDSKDKNEREKTLNERLKEMAGIKFDETEQDNPRASPQTRRQSDSKEETAKDGSIPFEQPLNDTADIRNPSPPGSSAENLEGGKENSQNDNNEMPKKLDSLLSYPKPMENMPEEVMDPQFGGDLSGPYENNPEMYGYDDPRNFEDEGPYGPFGSDQFRQGPPFGGDDFGPPADMMMEGPLGFGPPGFEGPPDRFMRGGRRGGRSRGRGHGRDGPDFFPRDDFGPIDDVYGLPPMRDEFPMRNDFGPPMRNEDFGPRGIRMRGRGYFGRGGPRGRGGPPFRDNFNPEFDGHPPPDFFRGGPRGRPFSEPFHRGRGRGFRGNRGRPDFFDGPPPAEFFDNNPPGMHFGNPPFESGPQFDDCPPGEMEFDRKGQGRKKMKLSRWGGNEDGDAQEDVQENEKLSNGGENGGGTPLRDEIDDCGPQLSFSESQQENVLTETVIPAVQEANDPAPPGEEVEQNVQVPEAD